MSHHILPMSDANSPSMLQTQLLHVVDLIITHHHLFIRNGFDKPSLKGLSLRFINYPPIKN